MFEKGGMSLPVNVVKMDFLFERIKQILCTRRLLDFGLQCHAKSCAKKSHLPHPYIVVFMAQKKGGIPPFFIGAFDDHFMDGKVDAGLVFV